MCQYLEAQADTGDGGGDRCCCVAVTRAGGLFFSGSHVHGVGAHDGPVFIGGEILAY